LTTQYISKNAKLLSVRQISLAASDVGTGEWPGCAHQLCKMQTSNV
jgi:hypothetical protein